MTKGMAHPNIISYNNTNGNGTSKKHGILEIRKERCKLVDADKSTTNESALEHTSMRIWSMKECTSLAAQNSFFVLDIVVENMFVQL